MKTGRPRVKTVQEEQIIVEAFASGLSVKRLASLYQVSDTYVYTVLKRNAVTKRTYKKGIGKYQVCQDVFDNLANTNAAYWLGFLYADGHIKAKTKELIVVLSAKDKEQLVALNLFLKSNRPIYEIVDRIYHKVRLHAYGEHLYATLHRFGLSPNRKDTCEILSLIPSNSQSHFIRGMFDGDGSASTRPAQLFFLGSQQMTNWIAEILTTHGVSKQRKPYQHSKSKRIYYLNITGKRNCLNVANWMYSNAEHYLTRKHDRIYGW
jgi:hypothetical protein